MNKTTCSKKNMPETIGIIAEYNPFHQGHKYQIDEIRRRIGNCRIIVAMSGDFVQRGTPALLDKYTRAEMALREGADLVIELPFLYATASAELFARGGVSLLEKTGIVDRLCFGAETSDLSSLLCLARILSEEPKEYRIALTALLSKGVSFPSARAQALKEYLTFHPVYKGELGEFVRHLDNDAGAWCPKMEGTPEELVRHLDSPNNILAVEYLKQLVLGENPDHSLPMEPILVRREGEAYHSRQLSSSFASASAIRSFLKDYDEAYARSLENSEDSQSRQPTFGLMDVLPGASVFPVLTAQKEHALIYEDTLSAPLSFRLISAKYESEKAYADCSSELLHRILKQAESYKDYHSFCMQIKNKSITYSHVSHALLNILFSVTPEEQTLAKDSGVPYLRILGFRRSSSDLLASLKEKAKIPIITSVASSQGNLSETAQKILSRDLYSSDYYNQLVYMQSGRSIKNDFAHPMVIV